MVSYIQTNVENFTHCVIIYTYLKIVICKCNNVHTGQDHALLQTFLKTTKLASISLSLIYLTMAIRYTTVHSFVLDSSLEKAFASMRKKKSYLGTSVGIYFYHFIQIETPSPLLLKIRHNEHRHTASATQIVVPRYVHT